MNWWYFNNFYIEYKSFLQNKIFQTSKNKRWSKEHKEIDLFLAFKNFSKGKYQTPSYVSGNFLILTLYSGGLKKKASNLIFPFDETSKNFSIVNLAYVSSILRSSAGSELKVAIHYWSSWGIVQMISFCWMDKPLVKLTPLILTFPNHLTEPY